MGVEPRDHVAVVRDEVHLREEDRVAVGVGEQLADRVHEVDEGRLFTDEA